VTWGALIQARACARLGGPLTGVRAGEEPEPEAGAGPAGLRGPRGPTKREGGASFATVVTTQRESA
jgi:hypothetical protein